MKSVLQYAMGSVVELVTLAVVAVGRRACVEEPAQEATWVMEERDRTSTSHVESLLISTEFPGRKMDPVSPRKPHPHSVDLLRNRSLSVPLGSFDGNVGAFAQLGAQHYFITSNTDYVPALPSLTVPHAVFLRSDMRYGTDDPTLWPQQWTSHYPHMPLISTKGSRPELDVMWWNPSLADFVVGSALVARCKELRRTSPALAIPLFGELIQHITMWLEQLQTLPTTYHKMVFALSSLQRAFLELDALYNYMTIYQARMNNYMTPVPPETSVAKCVGAFTTLWAAKVPFWFLRPVEVFDEENILKVVPLWEPSFGLPDPDAHGASAPPVLYSGSSTVEKIAAIKRAAVHTPWYHDPFETTDTRARSPSPDATTPIASSSRSALQPRSSVLVASGSPPVARNRPQQSRSKPYSAKTPTLKGPTKTERDKFSALAIPEMPPSIVSMADALAQVDRLVIPYTSNDADKRYVLPEPALLVNTASERRRKFLHHWNLLSDGFIYMLTQHPQLLRPQEWRDVLEGLLTKCGPVGLRGTGGARGSWTAFAQRWKRAICRASRASLCLSSLFLSSALNKLVRLSGRWRRRVSASSFVLWTNGVQERSVERGEGLFCGPYVGRGPVGDEQAWMGIDNATRAPSLCRADSNFDAGLDHQVHSSQYPPPRRRMSPVVPGHIQALETAVCRYYTQAFWEYFGHAAVVPLRLDHDLEKEEGEL
ncbi:hypothetical protein B0H10DRAFT_2302872 [Mycena sp. CBHHK59/15]|nr:hypothetical protein B0H10DRAFT_2302872 [Mycena sp. CBHHK59/15]